MLFCPKCKAEYENDKKACPKCGESLVPKPADIYDKEAFLISVSEGYQAEMVEGSLRSAEIPYVRKGHGGPSGFARFDTKYKSLGADFYVPSKLLDRAKEILPPVDGAQSIQETIAGDVQQDDNATQDADLTDNASGAPQEPAEKSTTRRVLSVVLFLLAIAVVIFGVDAVMNIFRSYMGY